MSETFTILSKSDFDTSPEFELRIRSVDDTVFHGISHVSLLRKKKCSISAEDFNHILRLIEELKRRNARYYLNSIDREIYRIIYFKANGERIEISIDFEDVYSIDYIEQIFKLTGVEEWIKGSLKFYLLLSNSERRSKEIAFLSALNPEEAIYYYGKNSHFSIYLDADDWMVFEMGKQWVRDTITPKIYFSYRENSIRESAPSLEMNLGPQLGERNGNLYLFSTFGKRYNDTSGVYFLVIASSAEDAQMILQSNYPHFQKSDFQLSDLKARFNANLLLINTHIPLALR
ncbi:hypothetical protein [Membranihabitans marinus]|uniref:hypothetical protein n=1 Tax=Membranihabitans marinus TaxID=1227546 RepID=UPI001F1CDBE4|nr:hypothetical protein [Membranihabitans marinus]